MKYYIKVTCAFNWARKLPRKTETYESAKCVPCNTRNCTHNGFVSDLLKWALKCRFYPTGPWLLKYGAKPIRYVTLQFRRGAFSLLHRNRVVTAVLVCEQKLWSIRNDFRGGVKAIR